MTVSVIVPTYNGAHKILRVLGALEQQTHVPDEVIVVIDGSTDETAQVLADQSFNFRRFCIVEQENKGRAAVRNRGVNAAAGQLLVFFDDDMRPAPTCLAAHVAHHTQHLGSIAVGYSVEDLSQLTSDFQQYKEYLSRKWFGVLSSGDNTKPITGENLFLTAANLSMPKAVFEQLGGFDEALRDIEDFDLGMRAVEAHIPVFFVKDAFAWHDDFVTCASYIKRLREYRRAHEVLRQHRPILYSKYQPAPVQLPNGPKAAVFRLFNHASWQRLIDREVLKALPKSVRYKVYDLVTTAQGVYYLP